MGKKKENGEQRKKDKRVKEEKRTDFPFSFYIVTFRDSFWREKNTRLARDTVLIL